MKLPSRSTYPGNGADPSSPPLPGQAPPIVLTIAGFDPSSGAGVSADLKVFAAHGLYALAVVTGLTVQSTLGVRSTEPVTPRYVGDALLCLREDFSFDGIKIGMLANERIAAEVTQFLEGLRVQSPGVPVVLDPVLRSSSGHRLLSEAGTKLLRDRLLPLVSCVTPNREELRVLSGEDDLATGARLLLEWGPAVVVTGGDRERPDDYVLDRQGEGVWLKGERVQTTADHGTGCAFSSALLCGLVEGKTLEDSAAAAKAYVAEAMRTAYRVGHGRGPLHHLFAFNRP